MATHASVLAWRIPGTGEPGGLPSAGSHRGDLAAAAAADISLGLPIWLSGKESTCQCRRSRRRGFDPWVRKIPWKRSRQPTPVFLLWKSHGQRSLASYSPWGHKELDMTEHTHTFVAHIARRDKKTFLSDQCKEIRGKQYNGKDERSLHEN